MTMDFPFSAPGGGRQLARARDAEMAGRDFVFRTLCLLGCAFRMAQIEPPAPPPSEREMKQRVVRNLF